MVDDNYVVKTKVKKKITLSCFLIGCAWPVWMYFVYIYCGTILKNSFNYSSEVVIYHNLIVSMIDLLAHVVQIYLCYRIYPLFIAKFKQIIFCCFILFLPFLLDNVSNPFELLMLQSFFIISCPTRFPSVPIFIKHFPVFKRFTYVSFLFAASRALMSCVTSFSFVYLVSYFGNYGLLIIILPVALGFSYGLNHFEYLEKMAGNYPVKPVELCD